MRTLRVDLADRSYPIHIGPKLLGREDLLAPHIKGRQVCLVTNTTLATLLLPEIKPSLSQYDYTEVILPDGEAYKNLETLNLIFDELLRARHTRKTTLIALGGGSDWRYDGLCCGVLSAWCRFYSASPPHCCRRWIPVWGGKTAVNHPMGKNMIGAFYQPNCVIADSSVLQQCTRARAGRWFGRSDQVRLDRRRAFLSMVGRQYACLAGW